MISVVGNGRLGTALVTAIADAGLDVDGPHGHGYDGADSDVVILCVPDRAIGAAAAAVAPQDGRLVAHCSGATDLEPLAPHESFSMHPLMTITPGPTDFAGAMAAIDGSTDRARAHGHTLATQLGMHPVDVHSADRAAYHAAACVASNYVITVLDFAERLAATTGVRREEFGPIVTAAVQNWLRDGGERALTGPVARGDADTVARHRTEVAHRLPDDVPFLDALVAATERLADH